MLVNGWMVYCVRVTVRMEVREINSHLCIIVSARGCFCTVTNWVSSSLQYRVQLMKHGGGDGGYYSYHSALNININIIHNIHIQ